MRYIHITLTLILLAGAAPLRAADGPKVGDMAPDFSLPMATRDSIDRSGMQLSVARQHGVVLLAFYPADWSGGCTREMCTMRDNFSALAELGVQVFGISGDYVYSHREWARSLQLPFALLSDHAHAVATLYASYNPATGYNLRTVFVVNRNGTIAYVDMQYAPGSEESFQRLRRALAALH